MRPCTCPPPRLPPRVQVCQYRCIVSYEGELFENFSLCILTVRRRPA